MKLVVKVEQWLIVLRLIVFVFLFHQMWFNQPTLYGIPLPRMQILGAFIFYGVVTLVLAFMVGKFDFIKRLLILLDMLVASSAIFIYNTTSFSFLAFFILPIVYSGLLGSRVSVTLAIISVGVYLFLKELITDFQGKFLEVEKWGLPLIILIAPSTVGIFRDIFNKQSKQLDSLLSLIETAQAMGSTLTYERIFSLVNSMIKGLFDHNTCVIYLKDEKEDMVKVKSVDSPYEKLFTDFDPKAVKSILSRSFMEKVPLTINDIHAHSGEELLPNVRSIRSIMVVPMSFEDEPIGAILVAHSSVNRYNEDNLRLLSILANQAAISIRNVQLHEATVTLAVTDSVSGLFTHGYFQEHLEKEFRKCKYSNLPLSLIILDVDHFKIINDTYGHPQGDSILRQLGGVIKSITRSSDVVCRYGGDEFTVTLPETNRIGAVLVAERIRQTVEEYEFVIGSKILHITVSGGVACFPEEVETKKELIDKSDKALYQAKHQGRNKVCFSA